MSSGTHNFVETPSVAIESSQSSVYIMGRMIQGLIPGRDTEVFSSEKHPEHCRSPPSLLINLVAGALSPWEEQPRL